MEGFLENQKLQADRGFTLVEVLVAMGIFSIITIASGWVIITALRAQSTVWDQLAAQSDTRRTVQQVTDDVRRAEESSIGGYPIETAATSTITIFVNEDSDGLVERVRYWLSEKTLKKGLIKPSGNPLVYSSQNEIIKEVAHDVVNASSSLPVFLYYDKNYTGTSTPLTQPVSTTLIGLVKVQLDIEKDPDKSPIPIHVEGMAQIRSLHME